MTALVAGGEGWHPGVIGIVAGRLKDKFHLPSVVIGWGEGLGPVAKGSARSVRGVNIGDAISEAARQGLILSGGGHAMAGGLSLKPDQLTEFSDWLNQHLKDKTQNILAARELTIDALISPGGATVELCDAVDSIGPFGAGAPQPVFAMLETTVSGSRIIGENHMKFFAEDSSGRVECVAWRAVGTPLGDAIRTSERLHIVGRLKVNEWQGRQRVQMDIIDAARVS